MKPHTVGILLLLELVSLGCAIHLWRRRDARIGRKLLWTPIVFVPLVGPIFYGGMFRPPQPDGWRKPWPEDRGGMPQGGEYFHRQR